MRDKHVKINIAVVTQVLEILAIEAINEKVMIKTRKCV